MPVFENLVGQRFGFLTVKDREKDYIQPSGQHKRMWRCVCDCGKECVVRAGDLIPKWVSSKHFIRIGGKRNEM